MILLASAFAVGAFAKRLQKEGSANGPGILPVQAALPLRPAVMSRGAVPVGMARQEFGTPGKFELRKDWKGPEARSKVSMQVQVPDWEPEEVMAMAGSEDLGEVNRINIRRAYDSLSRDIPNLLQFENQEKTPVDWGIYMDDLETDFPNIVESAAQTLFSGVSAKHIPSGTGSMKGIEANMAALQELRAFVDKFATKSEVTGQDWCMDDSMDWCVIMEDVSGLDPELSMFEGDPVITSNWKMTLTMNTELETHPEATITIQGLSRFHLNKFGKIWRHSIDGYDIRLNEEINAEEADLFLKRITNAPAAAIPGRSQVVDVVDLEAQQEKMRANIRRAYDSLGNDIPEILKPEGEGAKPKDWDIYTDDVQLDFPNPVESEALGLWGAVAAKHVPAWRSGIKGKAQYKEALQELRVFVANFVDTAEVTGQDWCMDKDSDWCVIMEELSGLDPEVSEHMGDQVITSNWKMTLKMKADLTTKKDDLTVTIQGLSRFHLNDEGKIYRHSIDGYSAVMDEDIPADEAKLFLTSLAATAPQAEK